jgi:hypothetical protein
MRERNAQESNRQCILSAIAVTLLLSACSQTDRQATEVDTLAAASPTATQTNAPPTATRTYTPTEPLVEASQIPASMPEVPLASHGPWVIFNVSPDEARGNPGGLWAVNPDGTGLTQIADGQLASWLDEGVAADGGQVAFVTAVDLHTLTGLNLKLAELPSGEVQLITPLVADGLPYASAYDSAWAAETSGLAWSPDGELLAFVAALDGASADLYVYSRDSGAIARLSDEPDHAVNPWWSPDGRHIVYGVHSSFGHGEMPFGEAIWVASADGSGTRLLYKPAPDGEEMLGWIAAGTALVASWGANCGKYNLRTHNLETGEEQVLWDSYFERIAHDSATGTTLIVVDEAPEWCGADDSKKGLYLLAPSDANAQRVSDFDEYDYPGFIWPWRPFWSAEAVRFFVPTTNGAVTISPSGSLIRLPVPPEFEPHVSPDGSLIAWTGWSNDQNSGLLIGSPGVAPSRVSEQRVFRAAWGPDSQSLFLLNHGLYFAHASDFVVVPVAEGIFIDDLTWVP